MRNLGSHTKRHEGFTLIELMVVVLIIAILIAIAIPTYLGARRQAADRATQANVRNAFTASRIYYGEWSAYTEDSAEMSKVEPSLAWTTTALDGSSSARAIYLKVFNIPSTAQTVVLVGRTSMGRCFYIKDTMAGSLTGTYYDRTVPAGASCAVPDPSDPAWGDSWSRS